MSNSLPGTAGFSSSEAAASAAGALGFPATDAQVHEFANGLELITKVDRSAPVASIQAWVRTGSIHESQHLGAGISHLVEHLVFKGTNKRSSDEIAQHIQDGGGYLNAYTSFDRTVYWVDTPAAGAETALDVIAGLVTDAQFPEDEYEREKDVIRREIDMGKDDPGRASSQLALKTVFREHPFREPVIGHRELFDTVTRDEAFAYYKTRYAPNNVFFVVTGDIDPEAIRAQLETLYSDIPRGPLVPPPVAAEPAQLGRREATRTFPHRPLQIPPRLARSRSHPRGRACARCSRRHPRRWPQLPSLPPAPRRAGARPQHRRQRLHSRHRGSVLRFRGLRP